MAVSFPQFTATSLLTDAKTTTPQAIVRVVNALVTNLQQIFTSLLQRVQLDTVLMQGVVLKSGFNAVPHTLGRTLTGWSLVGINAAATIYDTQAVNPSPGAFLYLMASAPCTVSLLVF